MLGDEGIDDIYSKASFWSVCKLHGWQEEYNIGKVVARNPTTKMIR